MATIEERLAHHPFLKGLSGPNIIMLAEDTVPMVFQPGEMLFGQGRKARYLYLVERGMVEVGMLRHDKAGPVVITHVGKGGDLGWSWAFPPYKWTFDAKAKTRVETLALDGRPVMAKLGRYPLLGYEFMRQFAHLLSSALEATRHQLVKAHHHIPEPERQILYFPSPIV